MVEVHGALLSPVNENEAGENSGAEARYGTDDRVGGRHYISIMPVISRRGKGQVEARCWRCPWDVLNSALMGCPVYATGGANWLKVPLSRFRDFGMTAIFSMGEIQIKSHGFGRGSLVGATSFAAVGMHFPQ